ncbi:hypothetical protein QYM36_019480 [Artemia franciscana]|uniref:HAT C-terminal dimerisation domain-containing protein n=1 Tax=Artemia franciscana TaxID=6661 RepID=A0AA88HAI0_ARTSF|nr:hypothetical protein QYM36_019480 [Artemia franciscana]
MKHVKIALENHPMQRDLFGLLDPIHPNGSLDEVKMIETISEVPEEDLASRFYVSDWRFKAIETEAAESVASCLSKEREKEILENRQYVKALLKTTALLGRQGLAFRGHDEGESSANQGNFVETVHLLTEINPDLMKNSRKAYGHYMSHDATKNELRKMRDDEYFRVLYGKSKEMAINVGADLSETSALSSAIPVKSKRVQKISGRLRDYLTTTTIGKHNIDSESTTAEDKMRREFYEVLDRVLNEFEERFSVQLPVLEATRCLNPKSKDFMDSDLLLVIATYFDQAGIDTMQLKCQALIARAFVSQLPQKPANALDVFERLGGLKEAYSELLKVVRVVLTLPLTTCSNERFFSVLTFVKDYLRTTMENERLSHLLLIFSEKAAVKELNFEKLPGYPISFGFLAEEIEVSVKWRINNEVADGFVAHPIVAVLFLAILPSFGIYLFSEFEKYHVLKANCEHFAKFSFYLGKKESRQTESGKLLMTLLKGARNNIRKWEKLNSLL